MPRSRSTPALAVSPAVYGDAKAAADQKRALPTPQQQTVSSAVQAAPPVQLPPITPLGAPTERPTEPITAGLPSGPGPGPESIGLGAGMDLGQLAAYLPALEVAVSRPDSTQEMRNFVRLVRANAPAGR